MLYKLFRFFLLIIPLFGCTIFAGQGDIQHAKLKNGLEVYVISNHRIPAVLHSVIYKVGSMDDPVGKSGLAHFFEHLMFKTMGKFKDVKSNMASIGAKYNAYTTTTHTCYWELVLKQDLPLAMEIEADRMSNFNLGESECIIGGRCWYSLLMDEKEVVLSERRTALAAHTLMLLYEEMGSVFYRTGYGRPVIGWEADIRSYNDRDVQDFYNNYYKPDNAVLLVVGDVKFDEVLKLAEEKYGNIQVKSDSDWYRGHWYDERGISHSYAFYDEDTRPLGVERSYQNQEPVHNANVVLTLESYQAKVPVLVCRYRVPELNAIKDKLMIDLAIYKLGGGKSSNLYKDLVLNKDVAVSAYAMYGGRTSSDGYIDITVFPKDGISLEIIEKELENSVNSFMHTGITAEELKTVKYQYKAAQFAHLSSLENIAWFYTPYLALNIPIKDVDISYSQVASINLDDVNDKIRAIFSANNKLIGRLLPKREVSNEDK